MGYNRSGTRRTARLKRRKRHEMRLLVKGAQQPQEEGLLSKVKTAAKHAAEKVSEAAGTVGEKVSEAAGTVADTVKDKMS